MVITIDGCQPAYLDDGMARGLMPRLSGLLAGGGAYHLGRGVMPSLTNPNNVSIVTGASPAVHGVPGNHFRTPSGAEVQLTDPAYLRAPTIHAEMQRRRGAGAGGHRQGQAAAPAGRGRRPVDQRRAGRTSSACRGSASTTCRRWSGRPTPKIYDWDASHYAMEIGLAVHRHRSRDGQGWTCCTSRRPTTCSTRSRPAARWPTGSSAASTRCSASTWTPGSSSASPPITA